jgi:hypothetical protein
MNNTDLKAKIEIIGKEILEEKGYLSSIDILLRLGYLSEKDLASWRVGKVGYLEKVCSANLNKRSIVLDTLKAVAKQCELKESWTGYNRYGKGPKIRLRFSKSGNESIEKKYATHYVKNLKPIKIIQLNKDSLI